MDAAAFFKHPSAELRGQIRCGRVSSSDAKAHTAQVEFFEQDGFVSHDMQILFTRPGDYSVYEKDTLVLCIIIDGIQGFGFVLGALYSSNNEIATDTPPLNDKGARAIASDDLRLGDPAADKFVALSNLVKDELDKIKTELDHIKTGLSTHTHPYTDTPAGPAVTSPPAAPPYTVGYSPTEPKAEKVKAK
jgi:hypothetical protein